jgi:hypothetical protein
MKRLPIFFALIFSLSTIKVIAQDDETDRFIQQFYDAMETIVNDYPNNFQNIIGGYVSETDSNTYTVKVELPGAESVSVNEQLYLEDMMIRYMFTAVLYKGLEEEEANTFYNGYANLIMSAPLTCCEFGYDNWEGGLTGEEEVSTVWAPVDDDNPTFANLLIQLRIYPSRIRNEEDKVWEDGWTVVLNISRY